MLQQPHQQTPKDIHNKLAKFPNATGPNTTQRDEPTVTYPQQMQVDTLNQHQSGQYR